MKIKSLNIKNFKSIVDLTIENPNPFTVFAGANGSGKSNIFEAIEFSMECIKFPPKEIKVDKVGMLTVPNPAIKSVPSLFGGLYAIRNRNCDDIDTCCITLKLDSGVFLVEFQPENSIMLSGTYYSNYQDLSQHFLRLFQKQNRHNYTDDAKLTPNADNLEKVLDRLLAIEWIKEEIQEWLELFLPEFLKVEVQKSDLSKDENLLIYQKHFNKPFNKSLISNGTFNILAILTAIYQSEDPQFLCIEEPENGLNPKVVKELVNLFRDACEEKGHYIWLNTHSQTLISQLEEKELIIVDKIKGETKVKQFKEGDFFGMPADEALLTNSLGGGLPW